MKVMTGASIIFPTGLTADFTQSLTGQDPIRVFRPLPNAVVVNRPCILPTPEGRHLKRGTVDMSFTTGVAGSMRSLFSLTNPTGDLVIGVWLSETNQFSGLVEDVNNALRGDLTDAFDVLATNTPVKLRFAWDSEQPIDGDKHVLLWVNGVKTSSWLSATSTWTTFTPELLEVGSARGSLLDFNGTFFRLQWSEQVFTAAP